MRRYGVGIVEGAMKEKLNVGFSHFRLLHLQNYYYYYWVYIRQHKCDNANINQKSESTNYYKDTR